MKLLYFILFCSVLASSQTNRDSVKATAYKVLETQYKDFLFYKNDLYALTKGDSLAVIDTLNGNLKYIEKNVKAIALDKKQNFIYVKDSYLLDFNTKAKISEDTIRGQLFNLMFDKENNYLVASSKGFVYKDKIYKPGKTKFGQHQMLKADLGVYEADVYFIDSKNRLWIGFDYGEFGGLLTIFDLDTKQFIDAEELYGLYIDKHWPVKNYDIINNSLLYKEFAHLIDKQNGEYYYKFPYQIDVTHIKGIVEDAQGNYYLSESLMHLGLLEGQILKLSPVSKPDFYKKDKFSLFKKDKYGNIKEYIGTLAYNKYTNAVYYYSDQGFFKIIRTREGNYTKQFVLKPWIMWRGGLRYSVGYQMNVTKFDFINYESFFFLTPNDGIGYYNGKEIKYFK